jgi:hypothetical protein
MIYPKNNAFVLSTNIHSLGLQNNMTTKPTFGSVNFKNNVANTKAHIGAGAVKSPRVSSLVPGMPCR